MPLPPPLEALHSRIRTELAQQIEQLRRSLATPPVQLVDADAVADMLACSLRHIEHLTSMGELVPVYIGRARRYDVQAIKAYVKSLPHKPLRKRKGAAGGSKR